jgi:hypothetical protein
VDDFEIKAERDRAVEIIDTHVNKLAEHFENVQIFCSRQTIGGEYTFGMQRGAGNVYARQGQVREWLVAKEEEARIESREQAKG